MTVDTTLPSVIPSSSEIQSPIVQRWAEIEIQATGGVQEAVGAIFTYRIGCMGYVSTDHTITGYLPVDDRLEGLLHDLRDGLIALRPDFPDLDTEITVRRVDEADWANAWKEFFKPQRVGKRLVIKPSWETWDASPHDLIVVLDPGMAFGTGHHATTRLCLQALENHVQPGDSVADVGTGSGILSVAAALLGASDIHAVDLDPLSVRIAQENVRENQFTDCITVAVGDMPPAGQYNVVVANILADIILDMANALKAATLPGGLVIVSGIIGNRAGDVERGLTAVGLQHIATETEGEWVAILLRC